MHRNVQLSRFWCDHDRIVFPRWIYKRHTSYCQNHHCRVCLQSSLRASSNDDLFQPRTDRRIDDRAFSVAAPRAWNRRQNWISCGRRQQHSSAIWSLVFFALSRATDYVMHLRADCRRRTINSAVTISNTYYYCLSSSCKDETCLLNYTCLLTVLSTAKFINLRFSIYF